jgi:hypothetical protein
VRRLLFKTFSVSRNFCEFGENRAHFSRDFEKIGLAGYFANQAQIAPGKTISVAVSLRRSSRGGTGVSAFQAGGRREPLSTLEQLGRTRVVRTASGRPRPSRRRQRRQRCLEIIDADSREANEQICPIRLPNYRDYIVSAVRGKGNGHIMAGEDDRDRYQKLPAEFLARIPAHRIRNFTHEVTNQRSVDRCLVEAFQNILQHLSVCSKANRTIGFAVDTDDPGILKERDFLIFDVWWLNNDPELRFKGFKIPAKTGDEYLDILVVHAASVFYQ